MSDTPEEATPATAEAPGQAMQAAPSIDWNVMVTLAEGATLREARRVLRRWGQVRRTHFYNVLTMTVPDTATFLAEFAEAVQDAPGIRNAVSHVIPARATFDFHTVDEFETRAREVALGWGEALVGRRFHVRLHRRGFKGVLLTPHEERFLDDALLQASAAAGKPARIAFEDPDAVIQIETIDARAGMSLWSREDLQRYPFLGVD